MPGASPIVSGRQSQVVHQLRERMRGMQNSAPRLALATHPLLSDLLELRGGGSYGVDTASLAMALMAGPSRAGSWSAIVGIDDFGVEAAEAMGVDLTRTIVVPDPGEHWAEVTGALIDVVSVVVLRPPARVSEQIANRLNARLRQRSAILVAWGNWPRCEARLTLHEPAWSGLASGGLGGHGHLQARQVTVCVRRGAAPPARTTIWLPPLNTAIDTAGDTAGDTDAGDQPAQRAADMPTATEMPAGMREVG
ncbi:MAG: hypothetical protein ACRCYU_02135 [Nocardioides sp.]